MNGHLIWKKYMHSLHDRLKTDLTLRNLSPATIECYLLAFRHFEAWFAGPVEAAGCEDVS